MVSGLRKSPTCTWPDRRILAFILNGADKATLTALHKALKKGKR